MQVRLSKIFWILGRYKYFPNKMNQPESKILSQSTQDDSSTVQNDDILVCSKTIRGTVHLENNIFKRICKIGKNKNCQYKLVLINIVLIVFGLLQIVFPLYDVITNIRLRMIPGLPGYEWWLEPPDDGIIRVYIFNVTNAEQFLNGIDNKIKLKEIGPIVYREVLVHKNIVFNENSTLTYTSNRTLEYLPDRNPEYILDKKIVMPNIAVLFVPSYLYDAPFFVRFGVNVMMRSLKSELFRTATINEFLWNMTDPILETSQKIAPLLVPSRNVGILRRIYENYEDNVTVYIGPHFRERDFFRIDKYDGLEYIPSLQNCKDKITGSVDDVIYFQHINKNDTLRFFRKTLCRVANLYYASDFERYGVKGYRFEMDPRFYDRTCPSESDCYRGKPALPNGLIDVSFCNYGSTIAASYPHFLHADVDVQKSVDGLSPNVDKHMSYVEVEPTLGIPFRGAARSQINIVVRNMRGFNEKLHKFGNLNIPLVWIEVAQENLPYKVQWLVYIQVTVIPIFQKVLLIVTFLIAFILTIILLWRGRQSTEKHSYINKALPFESEQFLKK